MKSFEIEIDYTKSLKQMVKDGKYDWVNSYIPEKNFPITGKGKGTVGTILVHVDKSASTEEVLQEIESQGLEPAKIEHLLSFGETYPEEQRKYPIIALGSVWMDPDGYRLVPYLYELAGERNLALYWYDFGWSGSCRFLAIRKGSLSLDPKELECEHKTLNKWLDNSYRCNHCSEIVFPAV